MDQTLTPLEDTFEGELILPGHPAYDEARRVWNAMIDRRPAVIAKCASVDDVAKAVRFGREHDLVIAVRCGGHSVGGFSTCDDGILIDLSLMGRVEVDPERRVATVGGGALLGALDGEAQRFGLACPVGVVSHTGVGGLTLGGGMGRLQRRFGFSIDNILSVDLVTADGKLVHASDEENPELFWGIRGAGPNFGVVTTLRYRLHPVGPDVIHGPVIFPIGKAHDVIGVYREAAASGPSELFLGLGVGPAEDGDGLATGTPALWLVVTDAGSGADAESVLERLRPLGPTAEDVRRRTYLSVQTGADEAMAWGSRFYMKGGFLAGISDRTVDTFLEVIEKQPGGGSLSVWAQGGAIARTPEDAMAFTGRTAPFWIGAEAHWTDPSLDTAHRRWGRATMDALAPFTAAGHYVNDMVETDDDVVRGIYGPAKYDRLVSVKREWDPDNAFRLNQNIRP
jgi:FAD/FMN-containing dehydrogenase